MSRSFFKFCFLALGIAFAGQLLKTAKKYIWPDASRHPWTITTSQSMDVPATKVVYKMTFSENFVVNLKSSIDEINVLADRFLASAKGTAVGSISRSVEKSALVGKPGVALTKAYSVQVTMQYNNASDLYHDLNIAQKLGMTEGAVAQTILASDEENRLTADMELRNREDIRNQVEIYERIFGIRELPPATCEGFGFGSGSVDSGDAAFAGGDLGTLGMGRKPGEVKKNLPSATDFVVPIDRLVIKSTQKLDSTLEIKLLDLWPTYKVSRSSEKIVCFGKA